MIYLGKVAHNTGDTVGSWHLLPYHDLDFAAVGLLLLEEDTNLKEKFTSELLSANT